MTDARASFQSPSLLGLIARSFTSRNSPDRAELVRTWSRLCRRRSLALCRLTSRVCEKADLERIDHLRDEMAEALQRDPFCAAKYADYGFWIPFNVDRIGALSLHRSRPLRILDIGCGAGYFMAAAMACGHDCYGVDAPRTVLTDIEARVYSEMLAAFSCSERVSPLLIERFVAMPTTLPLRDLDLITAFWICFNRHEQADEWGAAEWQFFVNDALSHLREGGILHLELNSNPPRYGSLEWYDAETVAFFRSVGTVQRNVIRVAKGKPEGWGELRKPA